MRKEIIIPVTIKRNEDLTEQERLLVKRAKEVALVAYAPYSKFSVGAALLLENGEIVTGSNQENAAYPSGTCAERTAIFYAGAHYPDVPVSALAIIAMTEGRVVESISPCGACRQVLAEVSTRYGKSFRVIMAGREQTTIIEDNRMLLPLTFDVDVLYSDKIK